MSPSAILQSLGVDLLRENTGEGTDMRLDTCLGSALGSVGNALGSLVPSMGGMGGTPHMGGTPRELGEHFKQEASFTEEQVRGQYSYVPELDFAGDREDTANLLHPDVSPGLGAPSLATPGMLAAVSGITMSDITMSEQASAQLAAMHSHSMKAQHMAGSIPSSKAMSMGGPALHQLGGPMLQYAVPIPSHSAKLLQAMDCDAAPMHAPQRSRASNQLRHTQPTSCPHTEPASSPHHVHGTSEQGEMGASSAQGHASSEQGAMEAPGHAMGSDESNTDQELVAGQRHALGSNTGQELVAGRPLPRCLVDNHSAPPFEFQPKRKRGRPPKNTEATNIALKDQPIQLGPDGQPLSEREKNRLAARLFRKRQEDYIARLEAKAEQLIQETKELENVKVEVTVSNSILRRRLKENQENGTHAALSDDHAPASEPISVPDV